MIERLVCQQYDHTLVPRSPPPFPLSHSIVLYGVDRLNFCIDLCECRRVTCMHTYIVY